MRTQREERKILVILQFSKISLCSPWLDFLKEILYQLGIEKTAASKPELLHILNEVLLQNLNKKKKTVLIVDDAQAIEDVATFEELRLLLNFQLNNQLWFPI